MSGDTLGKDNRLEVLERAVFSNAQYQKARRKSSSSGFGPMVSTNFYTRQEVDRLINKEKSTTSKEIQKAVSKPSPISSHQTFWQKTGAYIEPKSGYPVVASDISQTGSQGTDPGDMVRYDTLANYYTSSEVDTKLLDFYTKTEADGLFATLTDLDDYLPLTAGIGEALTGTLYGIDAEFSSDIKAGPFKTHTYLSGAFTYFGHEDFSASSPQFMAGDSSSGNAIVSGADGGRGILRSRESGGSGTVGITTEYGATDQIDCVGTFRVQDLATFDSQVIISTTPVSGTDAANKSYVDTELLDFYTKTEADGLFATLDDLDDYLPLTGGTLTGTLNGTSATFSGNGNFGNFRAGTFEDNTSYCTFGHEDITNSGAGNLYQIACNGAGNTIVTSRNNQSLLMRAYTGGADSAYVEHKMDYNFTYQHDFTGTARFQGSTFSLSNLPTSDPGVTGRLWNDSGTVKIST